MQKIILASQSPRRKEILEAMGVEFEVVPSDFDEQLDESRDVNEVACELALGKALAVARKHPDAYVIGSDTIVAYDGNQLGKPSTPEEAFVMLKMLQGTTHQVVTGVAVVCLDAGHEDVRADVTSVVFKVSTDEQLREYIATGDPYDKAGGYGIQSKGGFLLDHYEGDYETIIGLPSKVLGEMLGAI